MANQCRLPSPSGRATAIGANATVALNNSLVLGSIAGLNFATADTNVGIGTTAPVARLHIAANGGNILVGDAGCGSGHVGIGFAATFSGCTNYSLLGNGKDTFINSALSGSIYFRQANGTKMQVTPAGDVLVTNILSADEVDGATRVYSFGTMGMATLGAAGNTQLCRNLSNQISNCSSSLRYKTNFAPYMKGLTSSAACARSPSTGNRAAVVMSASAPKMSSRSIRCWLLITTKDKSKA